MAAWRGDASVAVATPVPGHPPTPAGVAHTAEVLAARGVDRMLTSAIPPDEQAPFLAHGFAVRERLHLLSRALDVVPPPTLVTARLRRGWRRDYPEVLTVDELAFSSFWRFDRHALLDARGATPSNQFRVAERDDVVGYAITGRAGTTCYLQRLAVHPAAQGHGIGSALVLDALHWARARRATVALVNTQVGNDPALALYERLGFRRQAGGLAVLERSLRPARATA